MSVSRKVKPCDQGPPGSTPEAFAAWFWMNPGDYPILEEFRNPTQSPPCSRVAAAPEHIQQCKVCARLAKDRRVTCSQLVIPSMALCTPSAVCRDPGRFKPQVAHMACRSRMAWWRMHPADCRREDQCNFAHTNRLQCLGPCQHGPCQRGLCQRGPCQHDPCQHGRCQHDWNQPGASMVARMVARQSQTGHHSAPAYADAACLIA